MTSLIPVLDDRTQYRNALLNILGNVGDISESEPVLHRVIRINNAGYTLPTTATSILPENFDDIYIGRIIQDGIPSLNNFVAYQKSYLGDRVVYLMVSTMTLESLEVPVVTGMYDLAANQRNYHALWFRSQFQQYMDNNPAWKADLPNVRSELESAFTALKHLGYTLQIPRFRIELGVMQDILTTVGFVQPTNISNRDYVC